MYKELITDVTNLSKSKCLEFNIKQYQKAFIFSVTRQYRCKKIETQDVEYVRHGTEESRADYCENVLGGKYSWGHENLVPGCNPAGKDPSNLCKCCDPLSTGMCRI